MQFNSGLFTDDENKVLFAASYLRGAAFNWFQPFQTTYLSEDPPQDSEAHKLLTSYTEFKKRLTEVFGMVNEKQDAERKILLLQQKGAASTYATEFAQLNSILGWPNDTLIAQFYKGLKDHVKDELVKIERPPSFSEFVALAVSIDNRIYERRLEKRGYASKSSSTSYGKSSNKESKAKDFNATEKRQYSKLTKEEKQRRREEGLCLYCGKSGHYANKCNQAPKSSKKASLSATKKDELLPKELKKIVKEVGMLQRNDEDPIFSYHSDSEVDEADFDYYESDSKSGPSMQDYSGADEDFGTHFPAPIRTFNATMQGKAIGKPLSSNATRQPQSPSFTSRNYYESLSKLSTNENSQKQLSGISKLEHLTYYAKI